MRYKTYVFCDLDKTLVDVKSTYDVYGEEPDYDKDPSFFDQWLANVTKREVLLSHPIIEPIHELLKLHINNPDTYVCYLTGRRESLRGVTQEWLTNNALPNLDLHMRPNGNRNNAGIFKTYFIKSFIPFGSKVVIIDDDPSGVLSANSQIENWIMVKPEYENTIKPIG